MRMRTKQLLNIPLLQVFIYLISLFVQVSGSCLGGVLKRKFILASNIKLYRLVVASRLQLIA